MRITPLDIRKQEFRKVMRGLDPEEVHAFLTTIADEYELVVNDNKALKERLLELDDKVQEYRNMEQTLRNTLLTAERVNVEAKENARREAGLIIKEAEIEAEKAIRNIKNEARKLRNNIRELKRQKESYISRLKMIAESHIEFIENMEKDFESEEKTLTALSAEVENEEIIPTEVRDTAKDESRARELAGMAEAASSETREDASQAANDKSILDKVPDLNDILDKMAKGQRETLKYPEPSMPPPAPSHKAVERSEAPKKDSSHEEKRVDSKDSRPESSQTSQQEPGKSGDKASEEEWSLERLKRDILSGDSQGNEENR